MAKINFTLECQSERSRRPSKFGFLIHFDCAQCDIKLNEQIKIKNSINHPLPPLTVGETYTQQFLSLKEKL
ncbi:hypothetical protein MHTCC0001_31210 [Flavobacteriaceae bacterium MHTCC 0001]